MVLRLLRPLLYIPRSALSEPVVGRHGSIELQSMIPYQIDTELLGENRMAMFAGLCSLNCAQERSRARCSNALLRRPWSARW